MPQLLYLCEFTTVNCVRKIFICSFLQGAVTPSKWIEIEFQIFNANFPQFTKYQNYK